MKHNQFPDQPESAPKGPTPEQLRAGYVLGPDETVVAKIVSDGLSRIEKFKFAGAEVRGTPLAKVTVSEESQAAAFLFERDGDGEKVVILDPGTVGGDSVEMPLKAGQSWGIGRKYEGQSAFPKTVSGDHCSIGLDESGSFVVENHQPTNTTKLKVFTSQIEPVVS